MFLPLIYPHFQSSDQIIFKYYPFTFNITFQKILTKLPSDSYSSNYDFALHCFSLLTNIIICLKQVLSVISEQIQNLVSSDCRSFMNPSQSESFWKSLLQDDIERRRGVVEPLPLNPPNTPLPSSHIPNPHPSVPSILIDRLQQQPMSVKAFEWNTHNQQQLFKLHRQMGNQWANIAGRLGTENNTVKNKFYSTLRRGLRKLNKYISEVRRKRSATHLAANKYVKAEMLVKVSAVADKTYEDKYEVKQPALNVSKEIQWGLIQLAAVETGYQQSSDGQFQFQEGLLIKIQEFNRNCKRRKGKRKVKNQYQENSDNQESEKEDRMPIQNEEISWKQLPGNPFNVQTNPSQSLLTSASTSMVNPPEIAPTISLPKGKYRNQEVQYPDSQIQQEQLIPPEHQASRVNEGALPQINTQIKTPNEQLFSTEDATFELVFNNQQSQEYFRRNYMKYFQPTPASGARPNFLEQMLRFQESRQFSASSFSSGFFNRNKEHGEMSPTFLEKIPIKYKEDFNFLQSMHMKKEMERLDRTRSTSLQQREGLDNSTVQFRVSSPLEQLQEVKKGKD